MKNVLSILYAIVILCFVGCQQNDIPLGAPITTHKCVVRMETTIETYDLTTRSSENTFEWENAAKLFLNFSNDGTAVTGVAEYNADEDSWVLTYTGNLNLADKAQVAVYYFTEYETNSSNIEITLTPMSAIYSDIEGSYSFLSDGELRVVAHLSPEIGRIRFKGDDGDELTINGISTNSQYNIVTKEVKCNEDEIKLHVGGNGYTPYVYGRIRYIDNELVLFHKYCRYERLCEDNVLKTGKSGVMNIPTQENHEGWELIPLPPTLETIEPTEIYDKATLNGRILSNGGDDIVEYGFLYGTDVSQLQEYKILDNSIADFSYTIPVSGDSTYYYQAYAVNSIGKSVGELVCFTPPSNIPTIETVDASTISHISGSKYRCTLYGKISNLNNSSLLDYGFIIGGTAAGNYSVLYYSIPSKVSYFGYYMNTNTEIIEVNTPYEFSYVLTFDSNTDYPDLTIEAYARNGRGMAIGEMIEEWIWY